MQLVSTNNSEKKFILKTQVPASGGDVKVKSENQVSLNGFTHTNVINNYNNRIGDINQVQNSPKPAYHKLSSVAQTLPVNLHLSSTPIKDARMGPRKSSRTKTRSKLLSNEFYSPSNGEKCAFDESSLNNYNALTKRLSNKCSDAAARAYRAQIMRKRDLMREQIDLELMFHNKKVPLTRKIYEMPYTAVIQHQLLPEDDNDPNISFPSSCSSESDHDSALTSKRSITCNRDLKSKSNDSNTTTKAANLITVGKRSAMSKQLQEKNNIKRKIRGGKRKLSDEISESSEAGEKLDDLESKAESGGNDSLVRSKKAVGKKSRKVVESGPLMSQKGSQLTFGDSKTLHCVCQTPYDYTKFYLKCDLCLKWFHGKCVGIDGRAAKKLSEFLCPSCTQNSNKHELYCVCKTPYDDSQFYIGCDECGDWFHGSCVGIGIVQSPNLVIGRNKLKPLRCFFGLRKTRVGKYPIF